jgi:hypothetical protein
VTKKKAPPAADAAVPGKFVRIASTKDVASSKERELLDRLAKAEAERDSERQKNAVSAATIAALQAAQRQGAAYGGGFAQEQPTGEKRKIKVFSHNKLLRYNDNGTEVTRPVFKTEDVDTFFLKIDLPPCGDTHLSINGENFYHGAVYEFDIHTLRTVKDLVFRCWAHDRSIHPNDENFYRRDPSWAARNARAIERGVMR